MLCLHVGRCTTCMPVACGSQRGHEIPGTGVTDGCESWCETHHSGAGAQTRRSGRPAGTLSHRAVSPAPGKIDFFLNHTK